MYFRLLLSASGFALVVVASACQVQGSVKGSANANEAHEESTFTANAPASGPAPAAVDASAPAPTPVVAVAAPSDACPLTCFEANGSQRVSVTTDEQTQLRGALEPVLGRMRGCTSPEYWRRHGSPVINLRIAPDGTLADLGVDPHHGREDRSFDDRGGCFDESGRGGNVSVALPGRKIVRCVERCVPDRTRRQQQQQTNATQTPRRRNRR